MKRYTAFFLKLLLISFKVFADDWNGNSYAQNSSLQLTHAERLLQSIVFNDNETILDVGSGDGKITALIARKCLLDK